MWFEYNRYQMLTVIFVLIYNGCDATNANFNEQLRDYSVNGNNATNVKTLQKGNFGLGRYASFAPLQNAVRFRSARDHGCCCCNTPETPGHKEVPDSELSGSSHGRGLLHHDTAGYGLLDYDDGHYGNGYEHQTHDFGHLEPHDYHHYDGHHLGHHLGYGHHHKHYDHALAAKTILWPIAGLALLGAAAALVTNPVLLQLGVVSGKRKRRQTEDLDLMKSSIKKWSPKSAIVNGQGIQGLPNFVLKRRFIKEDPKDKPSEKTRDDLAKPSFKVITRRFTSDDRLVPVPLEFREP